MPTYRTASEEETIELGRRLAAELPKRGLALLIGNLGAGKTTLAKGIVAGRRAAAQEEVSSPTFTLIHEYGTGAHRVYHIDLYRLEDPREAATLGLEDLLDQDALILVEWGERFPGLWPPNRTEIRLTAKNEERQIEVTEFL